MFFLVTRSNLDLAVKKEGIFLHFILIKLNHLFSLINESKNSSSWDSLKTSLRTKLDVWRGVVYGLHHIRTRVEWECDCTVVRCGYGYGSNGRQMEILWCRCPCLTFLFELDLLKCELTFNREIINTMRIRNEDKYKF